MGHDLPAFVFFLFLLVLVPPPAKSQPYTNITLGSSLVAGEGNSWLSPSGDFAFGFYSISYGFLLGIWFNKIPQKTIVWSVNRESPVQARSRVDLTSGGRLQLLDSNGQLIWSAEVADVAYAAMLDNGNFVLVGGSSSSPKPFMWQSFENPTDTILPSQVMNVQGNEKPLIAQLSETNFSKGHFTLRVQSDANLVFYTLGTKGRMVWYWSADTQFNGSRLVFNESGSIYWVLKDETIHNLSTGSIYSTRDFYQRAILEYDGVFRQYIYPKNQTNNDDWRMVWRLPDNICNVQSKSISRGSCGFNAVCKSNDSRSTCTCAPGHSYINPNDTRGGCIRDTVGGCDSPFEIVDLPNVNWPDMGLYSYDVSDEKDCQKSCEDDCLCDVAVYQSEKCWRIMSPMANGREDLTPSTKAFVKVWSANTTNHVLSVNGKGQGIKTWHIATLTILGISALLNGVLFLQIFSTTFHCIGRRMTKTLAIKNDKLNKVGTSNMQCFSFKTLEEATEGFSKELGRGSFGTVYEGTMAFSHQKVVSIAVKRLDMWKVTEGEKEFQTEVDVIGQTHHKNLVKLLGYCNEGNHRLLVYEFMSNGSLASYIFGERKPAWSKRVQSSVAIAKGLTYLHEECRNPVIHCDIKSQNVLLDNNYEAKISDFGLAKLLKTDQSRSCTGIRGTRGYVAPEWFRKGSITTKIDVYSFGIMLMEIISCRRSFEPEMERIGASILVDWVYDCYYKRRLDLLVGGDEEALEDRRKLEKMVVISIWCVEEDPTLRPSMRNVTLMLEGLIEVPPPPNPSSTSSVNY